MYIIFFVNPYEDMDNPTANLRQHPLNSSSFVCDRTQYINELIRMDKKIVFYDIRQHFSKRKTI